MTTSKSSRPRPNRVATELIPMDTTAALHWADTRCAAGLHRLATVGPDDHIYGPDLKPRPVGQLYCRHCLRVLDGAR